MSRETIVTTIGVSLLVIGFGGVLSIALVPGATLWHFFIGIGAISAGASILTGAPGAFYRDIYRANRGYPPYVRYREPRGHDRDWRR